ncbi:hypothetical protein [Micromonospora sp. CA-111912]|uniref:hypothetical protein n=1 Tax=Micromonospora sp. CA-111912 TaxID=3239955 RepID=UPI003D8E832C
MQTDFERGGQRLRAGERPHRSPPPAVTRPASPGLTSWTCAGTPTRASASGRARTSSLSASLVRLAAGPAFTDLLAAAPRPALADGRASWAPSLLDRHRQALPVRL